MIYILLMTDTAFIIPLAFPETIVMISEEWYLRYLRFIGIGRKNYVRAGHAAFLLIEKKSGKLDYFDFGRYITEKPNGRVRDKHTDNELDFSIRAEILGNEILNLDAILKTFATNPKLTHGQGPLIASVCKSVNYDKASNYIQSLQERYFVPYSVFAKTATNCSRFVTDTLIASVTDIKIRKKLMRSNWFTPSPVGNVLLANTGVKPYLVSESGAISEFKGSKYSENLRCFLDDLKAYKPELLGNIQPKMVSGLDSRAQWLAGIGAGAWFELHKTEQYNEYSFRRISPYGVVDVDAVFVVEDETFNYDSPFHFDHHSNCTVFHIRQNGSIYRFNRKTTEKIKH